MNITEQTDEPQNNEMTSFGMSSDDLSMLNQVLQQVKGSSCVSEPAFQIVDSAYDNDI